jgi:mRNA interferase RelE/StbE
VAYVRLTDFAVEDLKEIRRLDPSILRMVLTKMLLLEINPEAGEPLLGDLVKWRKLTVGDRHWRIIWTCTEDKVGELVIEIAQVWAVGARSDAAIYEETKRRIEAAPPSTNGTALADVLALLGDKIGNVSATAEPVDEPAPQWLLNRLEHTVGLPKKETRGLSVEQAMEIWEEHIKKPRQSPKQ